MRLVFISLLALACATPAAAQQEASTPQVLDQVYSCSSITSDQARLACYDAAVGHLREAQTSGNLVAVDRAQAQEIERDAFGFHLPTLPRIFGRGGNEPGAEAVAELRLEIARVVRRRNGPATFTMTNGQVWTQIDDANAFNARPGGAVTIRRALLGSYLMSVDAGGPAIRVRRAE